MSKTTNKFSPKVRKRAVRIMGVARVRRGQTAIATVSNPRAVNRRPNGTHYRRTKGNHLAALRWS